MSFTLAHLLAAALTVPLCLPVLPDPQAFPDKADPIDQAWLIHHGIETNQWKDKACKKRALELVDETKLSQGRLDEAMRLLILNLEGKSCGPLRKVRE